MANYKYSNVIDADGYCVAFVLIIETEVVDEDGTVNAEWIVQNHTLQEGESLVDDKRPYKRVHAGDTGIIRYKWDGEQWVEGATNEEIALWELDNPAPVVVPTETEQLLADVDFLALMGGVSL